MSIKRNEWSKLPGFCYACLRIGMKVNDAKLCVCKAGVECVEYCRSDMGKRLRDEWERD